MRSRTAISTAIWGASDISYLRYVPEFALSLSAQDTDDFDVVFSVSQNLEVEVRGAFLQAAPSFNPERLIIHHLQRTNGSLKNMDVAHQRLTCFCQGEGSYQRVMFLDPDDTVATDYVSKMRETLDHGADIAVADHRLFGTNTSYDGKPYVTNRIGAGEIINIDHIMHGNFILWSNSAMRVSALKQDEIDLLKTADPVLHPAGDWVMAFNAMARGCTAVMTSTHNNYRQHPNNMSGLMKSDDEAIVTSLNVKRAFYKAGKERNLPVVIKGRMDYYDGRFAEFKADPAYIKSCKLRQQAQPHLFLWENAAEPALAV